MISIELVKDYIALLEALDSSCDSSIDDSYFKSFADRVFIGKVEYTIFSDNIPNLNIELYRSPEPVEAEAVRSIKTEQENYAIVIKFFALKGHPEFEPEINILLDLFIKTVTDKVILNFLKNAYNRLYFFNAEMGIPNINYFIYKAKKIFQNDKVNDMSIGYLNIKECRKYNKLFGTGVTSNLISEFGITLTKFLKPEESEQLCHLGGDNFALMINTSRLDELKEYLNNVPVNLNYLGDIITLNMKARIGLAKYDTGIDHVYAWLSRATDAFAVTRLPGKNYFEIYDDSTHNILIDKMSYASEIKRDLDNDKFLIYYQPVVQHGDMPVMIGAEALIRWSYNGQIVNPIAFIKVAEEVGIIQKMDFYVLNKVCAKLREWIDAGISVVPISCNFSLENLLNPNLADTIIQTMDRFGIDHKLISIEFDESAFYINSDMLIPCMDKLNDAGIKIIVDNYGKDASSIMLLRNFKFDSLKLDQNFVNSDDVKSKIIIDGLIKMTALMGISVICEGASTKETVDRLNNYGCSAFQTAIYDKALSERFFKSRLENPYYNK